MQQLQHSQVARGYLHLTRTFFPKRSLQVISIILGEGNPVIGRRAWFQVKMARLKRAALLALVFGIALLIFGGGYTFSAVFALLVFLFSGGWKYVLLAAKTLPRDIR